jgi:adenosylcobinamide-GDP ribazoletransferase
VSEAADTLRLALGTLTVLRVRPPHQVTRRTAAGAMVLAPLVGLLLGGVGAVLVRLLEGRSTPLLAAALVVALLALLTRGLHLDGLADTADGLGAGRSPDRALEVMRRGDVGPFGVAALVLTLLVQVAALAAVLPRGHATEALVGALVLSRLTLPLVCSRGVPAARQDGLGSAVAGTVPRWALLVAALLALASVTLVWALTGATTVSVEGASVVAAAVLVPLAVVGGLCLRCVRRLGGVTGDVLGACVETAFTVCLVVLAVA